MPNTKTTERKTGKKDGLPCPKCIKVLSRKETLRSHCLTKHEWLLDENVAAPPEMVAKAREKRRRSQGEDATEQGEVDDRVSESSYEISISSEGEVEPSEEAPHKAAKKKKEIIKWDPKPISVKNPDKPCEKKKLEMRKPIQSMKDYLAVKGMGTQASKGVSTLLAAAASTPPSTSTDPPLDQGLLTRAKGWPDRGVLPSVRDVVGYRSTLPPSVTPTEVSQLASKRFKWNERNTVTSEQYVKGIIAGHDHATRHLLDGIQKYVKEKPATPQEAMDRWGWLQEWLDSQTRPPTPDQSFED